MGESRICDAGAEGMFLKAPGSTQRPDIPLGIVLGILMVYFFLGISIIAEIFMSSITTVTSRKRKVKKENGKTFTVHLWNETVATLTLMALGSSAPEIALAMIENFKRGFHSGDLGPSTIVGSAAFNLFVIVGVCIIVIPAGEERVIKNMRAFFVTAIFSVFAYGWMVIVLVMHTKDVIDVPEAVATLFGLPILVWISYSIDVGILHRVMEKYGFSSAEDAADKRDPHHIAFENSILQVAGTSEEQSVNVIVRRKGGLSRSVVCTYRTERLTGVPDYDFEESAGRLEFAIGQSESELSVKVLPKSAATVAREFLVVLEDAEGEGGADFDPEEDGEEESAILTVRVDTPSGASASGITTSASRLLDAAVNKNGVKLATWEWCMQIVGSLYVNGSAEEQKEAGVFDWIFFIVAFPWQMGFSIIVPPPAYCGGWVCFIVSIIIIGLLAGVVSDMAEMFGCLLEIPDIVTAVTFVALGTSMPDLFASLTAAQADPTADASIVNVTGSNSVNVFLGLGIPWVAASLYWTMTDRRDADWEARYPEVAAMDQYKTGTVFVVESRNLGFCVLAFTGLCCVAIVLLVLRRKYLGCELGGPVASKWASSILMFILWIDFVALAGWRVLRCEGASEGHWCKAAVFEQMIVCGSIALLTFIFCVPAVFLICKQRKANLHGRRDAQEHSAAAAEKFASEKPGANLADKSMKPASPRSVSPGTDLRSTGEVDDEDMRLQFEPLAEATPATTQDKVQMIQMNEGVSRSTLRKAVSVGQSRPVVSSPHAKANTLVVVIVVAYHSNGRNETVFNVKPLTPFRRVIEAWCQYHQLPVARTTFSLKHRLIQPDDTPAGLGHDPAKTATMVVHAKPRNENRTSGDRSANPA